jgi:hypothetical protein
MHSGEGQNKRVNTLSGHLDLTLPHEFEWTAELTHVAQLSALKHTRTEIKEELRRMKIENDVQNYIFHNYRFS